MSIITFTTFAVLLAQSPAVDDVARHQGTWAVETFDREGQPSPEDVVKSITRVVDGDHARWERDGKSFAGVTFELNPDADPRTIDLIPDGGPSRGQRVLGIYRFEDDGRLTLCVSDAGEPRPTEFSSPKGSKRTLQVFRRVDP